jgi:hypothetical protein
VNDKEYASAKPSMSQPARIQNGSTIGGKRSADGVLSVEKVSGFCVGFMDAFFTVTV